jgi:hypothetical protein
MPTASKRRLLGLALVAAALLVAAGCGGEEEELEVAEGEPIELGDLRYNVILSRTLNEGDVEDADYLEGAPPADPDQLYLGTFLQIHNDSGSSIELPDELTVVDTTGAEYEPVETDSPYALELGSTVPPHSEIPPLDTIPRYGPIEGSLVLFEIDDATTENRPLDLEIPSASGDETAIIELDI